MIMARLARSPTGLGSDTCKPYHQLLVLSILYLQHCSAKKALQTGIGATVTEVSSKSDVPVQATAGVPHQDMLLLLLLYTQHLPRLYLAVRD